MDIREKLVELLFKCTPKNIKLEWRGEKIEVAISQGNIADYLIANGVTVQEWISVKDRLPTIYDADEDNCVLAIHKASKKRYYHWRSVADNPFDFTHWMKTPQPPKGE